MHKYFFLAFFLCIFFIFSSPRLFASDNSTVLYFLLELQRQRGEPCLGASERGSPLPHLIPSDSLGIAASQGGQLAAYAQKHGVQYSVISAEGKTMQEVAKNAIREHCAVVMDPRYSYVGAVQQDNIWLIALASSNIPLFFTENTRGNSLAGAQNDNFLPQTQNSAEDFSQNMSSFVENKTDIIPPYKQARPGISPLVNPLGESAEEEEAKLLILQSSNATISEELSLNMRGSDQETFLPADGVGGSGGLGGATSGQKIENTLEQALEHRWGDGSVVDLKSNNSEEVILTNRLGKKEKVIFKGTGDTVLAPGGMLIDKNKTQGFVGKAPVDLMRTNTSPKVSSSSVSNAELAELAAANRKILERINTSRAYGIRCQGVEYTAGPLKLSLVLNLAAQEQAADMAKSGYFSSIRPDGTSLELRMDRISYGWLSLAENIARGVTSEDALLDLWLQDPEQCLALANDKYTEIGLGHVSEGGFWVAIFALPE